MNLLRHEQAAFDNEYFDPPLGYKDLSPENQKIAHIYEHLGKITGVKALHWATEGWEDPGKAQVVRGEVLPDLMIYRTQLVNLAVVSDKRMDDATQSIWRPNKRQVHTKLVEAGGLLASYVEPLFHGKEGTIGYVADAAVALHVSVVRLGEIYGVTHELESMHLNRLHEQAERHDAQRKV